MQIKTQLRLSRVGNYNARFVVESHSEHNMKAQVMMTTTELIKMLQSIEKGASGRSREISIYYTDINGCMKFKADPTFEITSTGDGCAGAEVTLLID